jgi:hypothetical protein
MTWHYEIKDYYDDADDIEGARRKRGQVFPLATAKQEISLIVCFFISLTTSSPSSDRSNGNERSCRDVSHAA